MAAEETRKQLVERVVSELAPKDGAAASRTRRRPLADVVAKPTLWLVPGLIPLGTLTLVAGIGGLGKSTYLIAVAAQASTGTLLGDPTDVLIVSFEDPAAEVLRPRLEAAQGDVNRVHEVYVPFEEGGPLSLPHDLSGLADEIVSTKAKLVVIDPIIAGIGVELDAHKDQHVRSVLAELTMIAEETACAMALVGHLNKTPSRDAYIRVANSVAFYNAARSVVLITPDPNEPEQHRLVSQVKANYARLGAVQRHVIEEILVDPDGAKISTSRMRFVEFAEDIDRNDVLSERRDRESADEKLTTAVVWLIRALVDGDWHDSAGLKALAGSEGISERTLKRAAQELGVEHERRGFPSSTYWRHSYATPLPNSGGPTGEEPHG